MPESPSPIGDGARPSWRPLVPIYVCVALFSAGEQALHVLVSPYLAQRLGQEAAAIGVIVAIFGLASLAARLPVGIAYRFDRALAMLVVGGMLSAAAFALVPVVGHPVPFAALMAVDGLGWALVTTTQLALLVAARPAGLPTAGAMAWYSGSQGLGHTLGGVTAGVVADAFGYTSAFLALAAVTALATGITVIAVRRAGGDAVAPASEVVTHGAGVRDIWRAIGSMPVVVWAGVAVMFYINFVSGLVNTFHPVLALAAGLSLTQIGALSACRSFASSAVRLGSGPLFSRSVMTQRLTGPLTALSTVAVVLIPSVRSSFAWQVPLFLGIGLSRGLLRITGSTDAFEGVGDDDRQHGLTAALLHAGLDLGKVAGPAIAGLVAHVAGLAAAFRIIPVVLVIVYGALELAGRRARERERTAVGV